MRTTWVLMAAVVLGGSSLGFGQFDPLDQFGDGTEQPAVDPQQSAAEAAYQRADYSTVIAITTRMIEADASALVPLHLRASARVDQGRANRSAAQIRQGIADARSALALGGKTYAWLYVPYIYGMSGLSELEGRPDHAKVAVQVANTVLTREGLTDAIKSQLLFQRGLAQQGAGDPASALADYEGTIRLNSKHLAAYLKRAQLQVANGDIQGALSGLNVAAAAVGDSAMLLNERGMLHRRQGDLPRAVADFDAALKLDRNFGFAYINRGVCELDQNKAPAAEQDFTFALKVTPDNAMCFQYRGNARAAQGKLADAESDFTTALKLNPKNALALADRGFIRFSNNQFAEAAADFTASLALQPQSLHLIPWRSLSLQRAAQAEAGQAVLDELLKRPAEEIGWVGTVATYLKGTIDDDALLAEAVDDNEQPSADRQCEARFFMGQKKLQAGDQPGAREQFEKAVAVNLPNLASFRAAKAALAAKPAEPKAPEPKVPEPKPAEPKSEE